MRELITILTLAVVLVTAGCGQKGELYREPAGETAGEEEAREDED